METNKTFHNRKHPWLVHCQAFVTLSGVIAESSTGNLTVEINRLKDDILNLASIGRNESDHGIYRMAFTEADMVAKDWLTKRIEAAGLIAKRDSVANISAVIEGDPDLPRIVVGSHIDTVPCAGTLDGTLGVLTGLECLRLIKEQGIKLKQTLELVAFSDEEGRFGGMIGSEAVCGLLNPERIFQATDLDGKKLTDEMKRYGLDPMRILDAKRESESIDYYLELHIEQGPVLDHEKKQVGIVENITGLFKWLVRLKGTANHAGTTPMNLRNDAFMGLADFAHEIPRILDENGSEQSRATIGKAQILPGSPNTVPGTVEFSLDVRDTNQAVLESLSEAFKKALTAISKRRSLQFEHEEQSFIEPVSCAPRLIETLEQQAKQLSLDYLRMPSGAAHDAQIMAHITPVGMIFVPSRGGKSHSPAEWTPWSDIEAGANLLLHTLIDLNK